jgi:hypothetical protein
MEYSAQIIVHNQKSRIAVQYENKPDLVARFRKLTVNSNGKYDF